jgi:hypothetical protein
MPHVSAATPRHAPEVARQQQQNSQLQDNSGYGIVDVSSFLGSTKQNRMVKEALSADFADQVNVQTIASAFA